MGKIFLLTGIIVPLMIFQAGCSAVGIRNYEMPEYEILLKDGGREIRRYAPHIIAGTTVRGEFKEAQRDAFRILADYIFGANDKRQKIAMTAPVFQKPAANHPPDAPVFQNETEWVMMFMMPAAYRLEDLPAPADARVRLEKMPAGDYAALRYTWLGGKNRNRKKAEELRDWLENLDEYEAVSPPLYAGYDPPWTLPFLRRNEIMIKIRKK